jgi:hypothetical protein
MPITLNHSNISVQYSSDKSYIIETVKSDLYLKNELNINNIVTNNLQTAPVTPTTYVDNSGNVYAVESYTYSGSANTADFTRVFPKNTTGDILIVGGGGGGGYGNGGGGGSGQLVLIHQATLNGTYNIKVGNGGLGGNSPTKGINSEFGTVVAEGGGANGGILKDGGSGAGGDAVSSNGGTAGAGNKNTTIDTFPGATVYSRGNNGGNNSAVGNGGGGGGAGEAGTTGQDISPFGKGGDGLSGISTINYDFKTNFGTNIGKIESDKLVWFAGGGGGGGGEPGAGGGGGRGGGGAGTTHGPGNTPITGVAGLNGTGSGGGGGSGWGGAGGAGGSGIVIIRYLVGNLNNLFPTNNYLTNEPDVVAPTFTETTRIFAHSGGAETQTTYTITVARDTICDILVVGGGGGGGFFGGGGGSGAILFASNLLLNAGSYTIKVGKGGTGASGESANGTNGIDSSILINAIEYISKGGGGGGTRQSPAASYVGRNGNDGGSGGGGSHSNSNTVQALGGSSNKNTYAGWLSYGNNGGKGRLGTAGSEPTHSSGGGGGAGSAGEDAVNSRGGGNGGSGLNLSSTFGTSVGHSGWFGGGGGGNTYTGAGNPGYGNGGNGLLGGGGNGGFDGGTELAAQDGLPNTGGGGGGAKINDGTAEDLNGGHGGSGIVIIKFKSTTPILDGITHKRLNFSYNSDNLVAWYKFNGDYLDSSGNGHNLTNVGTVIQSTQVIEGQAVEFDSTDYLEFPATINPYTIWNGKGITFSFWVRFTAHSTLPWARLIDFQSGASSLSGFLIAIKGTTQALNIVMNSNFSFDYSNLSNSIITTLGVWHHFAWSIDVTGKWDVYLNNVRINNNEVQGIPNITYNLRYINKSAFTNDGTWGGQIDDFRIYGRALSAADVASLYNKTYPVPNLYTLNFPVPTLADINNNSNIVLRGAYDIALSTTNSVIIPKAGQYIPKPTTFTNYSVERMYPPVRNFTAATTAVSGQTYGNGTYVVTYSSTYGENIDPFKCFNTSDGTGGAWAVNRYSGGVFNSSSFIVAGYLGDWLKIQLPVAIKLTRFSIKQRNGNENSPKDFKIYGSNDNITWVELVNKTDAIYNASYYYEQATPEITNTYTYYGLVVNKLLGSSSNATVLNFDEWYIYGTEVLTSSLSLRYHLLNPTLDPIGAQWTYSSNNTNVYHMGSVGIGTTSPEYQLDVRGAIYSSIGGYTQTGLTSWSITSDRRIKENITRASYDICLENVKNIELYNFNFKNNCVNTNDKHQLGFIAQEVQQVYPKAVEVGKIILNTNEAIDDILTLNTTQIDYTLYGAVKNLIEKIEDIDNDLESIEKLI